MFVWLSFTQTLAAFIAGCEAAWAFFGGVFQVLITDNASATVTHADAVNPGSPPGGWITPSTAASPPTPPARHGDSDETHLPARPPARP